MLISENRLRSIIRDVIIEQSTGAQGLSTGVIKDKSGYEFEFRSDGRVRVVKQPASDKKPLNRVLSPDVAKKVAQNLIKAGAEHSGGSVAKAVAAGTLSFAGESSDAASTAAPGKTGEAPKSAPGEIRDGEYSDPDDMNYRYRVLGGKYYILGRPGAKAGTFNPQLVTDPKEIARIQGQIKKLNQTAVPSNLFTSLIASAGSMAAGIAAPAQSALLSFVGMRQQIYSFTDPEYRKRMWYVVQAALKRLGGKPGLIDYSDYYEAQKLDPEYKNNIGETWGRGAKGPAAILSTNPYCQLSVTFGHCNFKQQGDEYLVYDRYEFILDRDPGIIEAANDYLFAMPFIKKSFESFKKGGFAAVADFEGLLVAYENTFNYRGYPTAIKTLKPDTDTLGMIKAYGSQFIPGADDDYYAGT
jgi:hypothetical protein